MEEENGAIDIIEDVIGNLIDGVDEDASEVEDVKEEEAKSSVAKKISSKEEPIKNSKEDDEDDNDEDLDFKDMPNGKIRYSKVKSKNDELSKKLQELEKELETMKASKQEQSHEDDNDDEPYFASETERLLYEEQEKLKTKLESVTNKLKEAETKEVETDNLKREETFVNNHSEFGDTSTKEGLDKALENAKDFFVDFFDNNKDLQTMIPLLKNGSLTLEQVYAMAKENNEQSVKKDVQDSSKVFSKKNVKVSSKRVKSKEDIDVDSAYKILSGKSDDKSGAVDVVVDSFVDDFVSMLG